MKKIIFSIGTFFVLIPFFVHAHVKWFAHSGEPVRPYSITDLPVLIWILASLIIILIGIKLERRLKMPRWCSEHFSEWRASVLSIASIGFGLAFLIFTYNGFIFAPNLLTEGSMGSVLLIIQGVAGAMILLGIYERIGALLILILFLLGIKEYGVFEMIDALEMVGFALYAFIIGRPKWRLIRKPSIEVVVRHLKPYGVPLLRVGTGLNLMVLGFSEKILAPSLTQEFLSTYEWNFMQTIGFDWFSNYWFAFSAGMVEILFGIFFILGLATRLTTVILAVFLVSTLVLLGPLELIGHLPHFSIAIVLFVLGSGSKLKLIKNRNI